MKASINKNIVHITGKICEKSRIEEVVRLMLADFNSMCVIEDHAGQTCEYTLSYSSDEATVVTVKESYSEAKKASSTI